MGKNPQLTFIVEKQVVLHLFAKTF